MANDFLKLNIVESLKYNNLNNIIASNQNNHLLNHNLENLKEVLKFLNSTSGQLMVLNGFMHCGKTCLTDFIIDSLLNDYIIIFNINFNGLNHIDDIYIQIYNNLIKYHYEHKIKIEKSSIKEFSQKILSYILTINQPILFVFDFDENNNDTIIKDLMLFIKEIILKHKNKNSLKVIINSLSFNFDLLEEIEIEYITSTIRPFNSEQVKYNLFDVNNSNGQKAYYLSKCNLADCEYFYKITRGHYLYIELIKILEQNYNISVDAFLNQYQNQKLYILDFIVSKLMTNYYNKFIDLFLFLTTNKFKTPIQFLYNNNLITEKDLNILLATKLIKKENNMVYVKSYIKKYVLNNINDEKGINIVKCLIEIYQKQLELSPLKRDFKVSRASLYHEIELAENYLKKLKEKIQAKERNIAFSSITYTKSQRSVLSNVVKKETNENVKISEINHQDEDKQPKKTSPFALSKEEQLLLTSFEHKPDKTQNILYSPKDNEPIENNRTIENHDTEKLDDLFKKALEFEKEMEYYKAIDVYNIILNQNIDEEDKRLIYTYTKLGMLYQKISNYKKALNCYKKALELCINKNETIKTYYIYYQIAKIYKTTFKNDLAKEIYQKILKDNKIDLPNNLKIQIINDYVELVQEPKSVIEILLKIKDIVNNSDDIALKIDYYYKLAAGFDDIDNIVEAKEYYYKCLSYIEPNKKNDGNKILGTIYFNLANICLDENNKNEAYEYFKLSLTYEMENQNYEEAYFTSINLGKMLLYKRTEEAYQYFKDALSLANKLNDKFYLAESQLNLGDYYYFIKNDEEAIKCFLSVLSIALENKFSDENIENVKSRLKDLKIRLEEGKYRNIVDKSNLRGID